MDTIPYFLTFILLIFSIWTFFKVQKYQQFISKKNIYLEIEIENERKNEAKLKSVSDKINELEKNTHQQFLKINVTIFNVDFTINEIFSNG